MKKSLIHSIICPLCENGFSLEVFEAKGNEIKAGVLSCSCGQWYPIIQYIPRILCGPLRSLVYDNFPDFFKTYGRQLPREGNNGINPPTLDVRSKLATSKSFGYEWKKFSKMIADWEQNFKWYFEPCPVEAYLRDKLVLEVGCGKGRHTYYAARYAREIYSVDVSLAVDVARKNNAQSPNIHFIQADIFNLPFKRAFFDSAFSLGVLHHVPHPEEGFKKMVELVKHNGGVLVYVYHKLPRGSFKAFLLRLISMARHVTTRVPHGVLYALSWPIASFSYIFIILPYAVLRKIKFSKNFAELFPLKLYADYPFQVILNDTFDRFSAPIENRYSKQEILAWFTNSRFRGIEILGGGGWRIFGIKQ